MGVLDTFYILFKTDADKAAKDVASVGDAGDKAEAGLNKADAASARLSSSFMNMAKALAAPILALASVGSLTTIAIERAAAIRELDTAATKLNSSVSSVDAFQRSVKAAGGETAGAVDSLTKLGEKLNEAFADAGSGARKDFREWGLAFRGVRGDALGAVDGMVALAANLEKVSQAEALARIKKLGIEDPATIELLLKGKRAVEEAMAAEVKQGVVTKEQARIAREYQGELGKTGNLLTSLGNRITETFLPAATKTISAFRWLVGWMVDNQRLVEGFFIGIATVVTITYLPALRAAAAATIAATWPFLAIGAAIAAVGAAFALAYEDVMAFLNGQPSLIGELAAKYEWFGNAVNLIGEYFKNLGIAWGAVVDGFRNAWTVIAPVLQQIAEGAKSVFDAYVAIVGPLLEAWSNLFGAIGKLVSLVVTNIAEGAGMVLSEWAASFGKMGEALQPFQAEIDAAVGVVTEVFRVMTGIIKDLWTGAINFMTEQVQWLADKINGVIATLTGGVRVPVNVAVDNTVAGGRAVGGMYNARAALSGASGSPLNNSVPGSAAAGASSVDQSSTTTIGTVTVNTQATDAKGIASALRNELQSEFRTTSSRFDDGVTK